MMGNEASNRNTDRDWDNRSDLPGSKPMGQDGLGRDPLAQLVPLAMRKRYDREQKIYCQEEAAEYWYHVVSGVLRRSVIWPDGRRQIMDFLLPEDFFGFAGGDEHHFFT